MKKHPLQTKYGLTNHDFELAKITEGVVGCGLEKACEATATAAAELPPLAKTAEQHVAEGVLTYVALVAGLCGLMWALAGV